MPQPTSQPIEIFLGKNGQTFGPYTADQFEAMKAAPDFATYTFVWDGREAAPDWKPLEKAALPPPPPKTAARPSAPPPDHAAHATAPIARTVPAPAARAVLKGYDVPGLEALCHDSRNVITGKLTQVTDSGCELVCPQNAVAPGFGSKASIMLNLLDPKTGRSMNVPGQLGGFSRKDGYWSLKVLWDGCPELVVQQLEKSA